MRCVDCGREFEEKHEERRLKATFDNPGVVFFTAKAAECPDCGQNYIDEENIDDALDNFEDECGKKQESKK